MIYTRTHQHEDTEDLGAMVGGRKSFKSRKKDLIKTSHIVTVFS